MWDLPRPGMKPVSPALAGGLFTIGPPRKPLKSSFKTSSCYTWILSLDQDEFSWEEEKLSEFKRLCLTDHVLEFSTETSTQKELSKHMLSKHVTDYKMKLWGSIRWRTNWPYQERLLTGETCSRVSSQEGWRNEWTWDAEPSHIPSQPPSPLCLLLIPSLSSLIKRGR